MGSASTPGQRSTSSGVPERPWTIGLLSPVVHGFYFGSLLAGVVDAANRRGGQVIAIQALDAGLDLDAGPQVDFTARVAWQHIDAFIVVQLAITDEYLRELLDTGKPTVAICREIVDVPCPTVLADNRGGIDAVLDHLVEHGHTRIAFAGRSPAEFDSEQRYSAYREGMLARGLRPDEQVLVPWLGTVPDPSVGIQRLLRGDDRPTAVVACADMAAVSVVSALTEAGLSVPGDIAVVGFDDLEDAVTSKPSLTTVRQSFTRNGALACDLALDALEGRPAAAEYHYAPVSLVRRESCGCDPAAEAPPPHPDRARPRSAPGADDPAGGTRPGEYQHFEAQRQRYKISTDLVRRYNRDVRSLAWLSGTQVQAGCLALWENGRNSGEKKPTLRIVGAYDRGGTDRGGTGPDVGGLCEVREFPPAGMVELLADRPGNLIYLLSVRFDGSDWGFLALVGPLDAPGESALELYNQWTALLTVALDQEQNMRSEHALLEEIRLSEERYALAAEAASDGLWDWNIVAGTTYYSRRWKSLLGYTGDQIEATPEAWLSRLHPDDRPLVDRLLAEHFAGDGTTLDLEYRIRAADGTYRWMLTGARTVRDETGRATRLVASMTDVTERRRLEERLRRDASYDPLTGLPNRNLFLDRLNRAVGSARSRPGRSFAVIFLDLDGFKIINDSLGHQIGDAVLVKIAERLVGEMRTGDTVARFGGDEFVLLLNDVPELDDVCTVADRILAAVGEPLAFGGRSLVVTAAAGIAVSRTGYRTANEVIRDADTAMYRAKAVGSGAKAVFDESMHAAAVARLQLESDLRRGITERQFELYHQPILALAGRRAVGTEALIRWPHPVRGLLPPDDFLPLAEVTGLARDLGRFTIRQACRQLRSWREGDRALRDLAVSVNLSNRQFWDPQLRTHLSQALADFDVPPSALVFEVTEGVIMHNQDAARDLMQLLRDDGIRLHVDDFGTGYSSLAMLNTLPVDALKIDRSFTSRILTDARGRELVHTMITMGLNLGLTVVAEGIETEDQAALLTELGCPLGQGYLFSRPVPGTQIPDLLAAGSAAG